MFSLIRKNISLAVWALFITGLLLSITQIIVRLPFPVVTAFRILNPRLVAGLQYQGDLPQPDDVFFYINIVFLLFFIFWFAFLRFRMSEMFTGALLLSSFLLSFLDNEVPSLLCHASVFFISVSLIQANCIKPLASSGSAAFIVLFLVGLVQMMIEGVKISQSLGLFRSFAGYDIQELAYIIYSLGNLSFMAFLAWCWFLFFSRTKFTESFLGQLKFCFYAYIFIYLAVLSLYGNSLKPPVVGVINNTIYPLFSVPAAFRLLLIFSLFLCLKQKLGTWTQSFALSHLAIFCLAIYLIYTSSAPAYLAILDDPSTSLFSRFIDNHVYLGVGVRWKILYYDLLMQEDLFQSNIIWSDVLLLLYSKGIFVAAAFLLLLFQGLKTAINSRPFTLLSVVLMVTPLVSFFLPVLISPLNLIMYAICFSMLRKSESDSSMSLITKTWERFIPKLVLTILLLISSWVLVNASVAAVKVYLGPVRLPVTGDYSIPDYFIVQLVATEDRTFFQHKGLCHLEIRRSLSRNLKALKFERGASTISMQLAKLLYLKSEKTLSRKLQQILIAIYLESVLNKGEILYRYISLLDFGEGRVGLKDASNYYFHKDPSALSFKESTLLVASVVNPKIYRPEASNKDTISRAQTVIDRASLIYPVLEPQARALPYAIAKDENSPNDF